MGIDLVWSGLLWFGLSAATRGAHSNAKPATNLQISEILDRMSTAVDDTK